MSSQVDELITAVRRAIEDEKAKIRRTQEEQEKTERRLCLLSDLESRQSRRVETLERRLTRLKCVQREGSWR